MAKSPMSLARKIVRAVIVTCKRNGRDWYGGDFTPESASQSSWQDSILPGMVKIRTYYNNVF
jgi:hypothetical protein